METDDINRLIEKYFEGESTLQEETTLQSYFLEEEVPTTRMAEKAQFQLFSTMRHEVTPDMLKQESFFSKITRQEDETQHKTIRFFRWSVGIAASFIIMLLGFVVGMLYEKNSSPTSEVLALKDEFSQMKKMLMFNQMNNPSASERIMAVNTAQALPEADDQVLEALIFTMNSDVNPNVRLSAVEALHRFADQKMVMTALVKSLNTQENPIVQIAIIDVLVDFKEQSALDELRKLLQKENLTQAVREQAEYGVSQLAYEN